MILRPFCTSEENCKSCNCLRYHEIAICSYKPFRTLEVCVAQGGWSQF
jgi:hypothetical protein